MIHTSLSLPFAVWLCCPFHPEMESTSPSSLNRCWPCDLFSLVECCRRDILRLLRPGRKEPGSCHCHSYVMHLPSCKRRGIITGRREAKQGESWNTGWLPQATARCVREAIWTSQPPANWPTDHKQRSKPSWLHKEQSQAILVEPYQTANSQNLKREMQPKPWIVLSFAEFLCPWPLNVKPRKQRWHQYEV